MLTEPFRGTVAVARGLVTPARLRGPRFRRFFPDIYVRSEVPVDLALRSRAAHLFVAGRGVLGGFSAAEVLGASCGPADAPAEVVMLDGHRQRPLAGLTVRRAALWPDEITEHLGMAVTTPDRTAYDLARGPDLTEAVVAVDALTHMHEFPADDLRRLGYRHLGARGSEKLREVIRLANPLSGSPMETRIRLAILFGGLPVPVLQHPVGPYALDLSYPALHLGIEYDGREHLTRERARRDLVRQDFLTAAGWHRIIRFPPATVLHHPDTVAAVVRARLFQEAHTREMSLIHQ